MCADILIGGIEGGATHSKIVLFDSTGRQLSECNGPGVNHWILGMTECQTRLHDMVVAAKRKAGVSEETTLQALGMSLSGCEQAETNEQLSLEMSQRFPQLSQRYFVCSDTVGSIAAANDNGGVVLIAGTGSNALLLNPDGSTARCGGWGHMLGDEGGAWWIAHLAIKTCFDEQDRLHPPPHPTTRVWAVILRHFDAVDRFGLLDHCYSSFDKPRFAALTAKLADAADEGDPLARWLFQQAGASLASALLALLPRADKEMLSSELRVVCVGSVWLSWQHLSRGFSLPATTPPLTLVRLKATMATGAAFLAARAVGIALPRDLDATVTVFHRHPGPMPSQDL